LTELYFDEFSITKVCDVKGVFTVLNIVDSSWEDGFETGNAGRWSYGYNIYVEEGVVGRYAAVLGVEGWSNLEKYWRLTERGFHPTERYTIRFRVKFHNQLAGNDRDFYNASGWDSTYLRLRFQNYGTSQIVIYDADEDAFTENWSYNTEQWYLFELTAQLNRYPATITLKIDGETIFNITDAWMGPNPTLLGVVYHQFYGNSDFITTLDEVELFLSDPNLKAVFNVGQNQSSLNAGFTVNQSSSEVYGAFTVNQTEEYQDLKAVFHIPYLINSSWKDTFETGNLQNWIIDGGGPRVQNEVTKNGNYALELYEADVYRDLLNKSNTFKANGSTHISFWYRSGWDRFEFLYFDFDWNYSFNLQIYPDEGGIYLYDYDYNEYYCNWTPQEGEWYFVEVDDKVGMSDGRLTVKIDGVTMIDQEGIRTDTGNPLSKILLAANATTVYIDDFDISSEPDLKGVFFVGMPDLKGQLSVQHSASTDLKASLAVVHFKDLLGKFVVTNKSSNTLLGSFTAQQAASTNLKAILGITQYKDLLGKFTATNSDLQNLKGTLTIRKTDSKNLKISLGVAQFRDLKNGFTVQQSSSQSLKGKFTTFRSGSANLKGKTVLVARDSQSLKEILTIRGLNSQNLKAGLGVKHVQYASVNTSLRTILPEQQVATIESQVYDLIPEQQIVTPTATATQGTVYEQIIQIYTYVTPFKNVKAGFNVGRSADTSIKGVMLVTTQTVFDIKAGFRVTQEILKAKLIVQGANSFNIKAKLYVISSNSKEVKASTEIRRSATHNIYSHFDVGRGTRSLKAKLHVSYQIFTSTTLKGVFFLPQANLKAKLSVDHSRRLKGIFTTIRSPRAKTIKGKFFVNQNVRDLKAYLRVRPLGEASLKTAFFVGGSNPGDLKAIFSVLSRTIRSLKSKMWVMPPNQSLKGVLTVRQEVENLPALATIRHSSTQSVKAVMIVTTPDTEDVLGYAEIRRTATIEVLGIFNVFPPTYVELSAGFTLINLHYNADAGLLAKLEVVLSSEGASEAELLGVFDVKQPPYAELRVGFTLINLHYNESSELLGYLEVVPSSEGASEAELLGTFTVAQPPYSDLIAGFTLINLHYNDSSEVLAYLEVVPSSAGTSTAELLGVFDVKQPPYAELIAGFTLINLYYNADADLLGYFEVVPSSEGASEAELLGTFTVIQPPCVELRAGFTLINLHYNDSSEVLAYLEVVPSNEGVSDAEVLGVFSVKQPPYADLVAGFTLINLHYNDSSEVLAYFEVVPSSAGASEAEMPGVFNVKQPPYSDLVAGFTLINLYYNDSAEILAYLEVVPSSAGTSTAELLGVLNVKQPPYADLVAGFTLINFHYNDSVELLAYLEVIPSSEGTSEAELLGVFDVKQPPYAELIAGFTLINLYYNDSAEILAYLEVVPSSAGTSTAELLGVFDVKQPPYVDLVAGFTLINLHYNDGAELLGYLEVIPSSEGVSNAEVLGVFSVKQPPYVELRAGFTLINLYYNDGAELLGCLEVVPSNEGVSDAEVLGVFSVKQPPYADLIAGFTLINLHYNADAELLAYLEVVPSSAGTSTAELLGSFAVEQPPHADLIAGFTLINLHYNDSQSIKGSFTVSQQTESSTTLKAIINIIPSEVTRELYSAFSVRNQTDDYIITEDVPEWANFWVRSGTGFMSMPKRDVDSGSLTVELNYEAEESESLTFGWSREPYYGVLTGKKRVELKAGFLVTVKLRELKAGFSVNP
jgi:hypothetical protein